MTSIVHNKMLTNHQVVIVKDDYFDRMMPSFFTCFLLISFIYLHYDMAIETIVYLGLKFEFHRSHSQRYLTSLLNLLHLLRLLPSLHLHNSSPPLSYQWLRVRRICLF
ncbi:unnamed protein product [Brassica rapa subsp. trilocularis]